ncbi:hypothetical protein [Clostridium pasteurianum]|uniref:Prophage protein n=1 Tax=Clostridium pasteurianum BC1 TaxID=86416 RepID=R4K4Z0_CLOPA|nr:hypothetical protein [Clostridium pasteurianum]AGK97633.1 hypothetical protein Clopa_2795 [Clostridium pasteurianum BC1]
MALNTIALATMFQQELDNQIVAKSTSGWMEQNANNLIFTGNATVKVPKMTTDGLGNYDKSNGYASGGITTSYETFTMGQDRARKFYLDSHDVTESNFVATASNAMATFQRVSVIPEIDAYRYSKIATTLIAGSRASGGYTPSKADILTTLKTDINNIQDVIGIDTPLVVVMSTKTLNTLELSSEIVRQLQVGDFQGNNDYVTPCKFVDECPILEVPSARLMTAYTYNDGITVGQTQGGFVPAGTAKHINWLIMPVDAPIAIQKTDTIRIFDPSVVQNLNAWQLDYRKYHDLFIEDNKLPAMFANIEEALS